MLKIIMIFIVKHSLPYYETQLDEAIKCESNGTIWLDKFQWKYPHQRTIRESKWPPGFEDDIYESKWSALMALLALLRYNIDIFRTELKANQLIIDSPTANWAEINVRFQELSKIVKSTAGIIKEINELLASDAGMMG